MQLAERTQPIDFTPRTPHRDVLAALARAPRYGLRAGALPVRTTGDPLTDMTSTLLAVGDLISAGLVAKYGACYEITDAGRLTLKEN